MKSRGCVGLILLTATASLSLIAALSLATASPLAASSASQLPALGNLEEWNRTFGGHYGDGVWSIQETNDGGYLLAGYTSSRGEGSDLWLVKVDSEGRSLWNRIFGGSGEDAGYFVQNTRDGGSIITGSTKSYGVGEERLWLLKADSNGSKQWDRTFGGFVSSAGDGGWSVNETDDGGYIVTGYTKSYGAGGKDLWLIKTDSAGKKQWDKTFGGSEDDVGMSVIQAADGGYIVAGRTASYGSGKDDIWLLKTDFEGRELWNRTFGGALDDVGFLVVELDDGYAIVGRTESGSEGKRAILIKTDLLGTKKWETAYMKESTGISVQRTSDGGFIIAGRIDSPKTGKDAILIKTDPSGREEWALTLGGPGEETGCFALEGRDGGYLLAGITDSFGSGAEDAWLFKLRPGAIQEIEAQSGGDAAPGSDADENADKKANKNAAAINSTAGENAVVDSVEKAQDNTQDSQNIFKQRKQLFPDVFPDKDLGYKPLPPVPTADLLRRSGQSA
jgi:hypothetical protein